MGPIFKKENTFSLVVVYCNYRVLLVPTSAAGGALDPSKWKLHLLSSRTVSFVPCSTGLLRLALSRWSKDLSASSEVPSISEKERNNRSILSGEWVLAVNEDQYEQK